MSYECSVPLDHAFFWCIGGTDTRPSTDTPGDANVTTDMLETGADFGLPDNDNIGIEQEEGKQSVDIGIFILKN